MRHPLLKILLLSLLLSRQDFDVTHTGLERPAVIYHFDGEIDSLSARAALPLSWDWERSD